MSNLLEQASLVMIPSGYKEDVVYSVIPTSGAGDLTFTRASDGTRIDSDGNVEVVPWNLYTNSENATGGNWGAVYNISSITANSTTAPNGTNTGNLIVENSANGTHWFEQSFSAIYGTPYTISIYFKAKERTQCVLYGFADNGVFAGQIVIFNLSTGSVVSQSGTQTNSIENVGNGWYRCSLTLTAGASATGYFAYGLANGGSRIYQGDGTSGLYMWGRQLNTGTLKPYFPTTDRLNVPRITYQNGGGGCPSLLLEKQSTNLFLYSEEFSSGNGWFPSTTGGSIASRTADYGISPDGTQNADRIQLALNGQSYADWVSPQYSTGIGVVYTYSIWMKSLSGTPTLLFMSDGSVSTAKTLTTEWVRYTHTFTAPNSAITPRFLLTSSTSSTADILAWGAQLEASSYATSYIPTTSTSATRVADACYKTGISSLIGQTEGTMFADVNVNITGDAANFAGISINDGTSSNAISFGYYQEGRIQAVSFVSGSLLVNINLPSFGLTSGNHKFALAYKLNDYVFYVDGVQVGSDTSASVPATSVLLLSDLVGADISYNQAVLFPTRLTNSELAQLTGNQNYTINQAYESYGVASESPNCVQP